MIKTLEDVDLVESGAAYNVPARVVLGLELVEGKSDDGVRNVGRVDGADYRVSASEKRHLQFSRVFLTAFLCGAPGLGFGLPRG